MIRDQRGFTLTEIMVVVAILGVMAVAAANVSSVLMNASRYSDRSQSLMAVSSAIRERLNYQDVCNTALSVSQNLNKDMILNDLLTGKQEITFNAPGIQSGPESNGDLIAAGTVLPQDALKITSLKLVNVLPVKPGEYIAQIEMTAETNEGFHFKPVVVGVTDFVVGGTPPGATIDHCVGQSSTVTTNTCEDMGCKWDASASKCQCIELHSLCATGQVAIGYSGGYPNCVKLGGSTCGPGQYLVSVGVGNAVCANPP